MSEPHVSWQPPLTGGRLLRRYKRFLTDVRLDDGREVVAHCPSPGGMLGLLSTGSRVWLSHHDDPRRKLAWTWQVASQDGVPVGINGVLANRLAEAAVGAGAIPVLGGYSAVRREVRMGERSRVDLLLEGHAADPRPCFVEVKTVTMASGGVGRFLDAVTARGLRHLEELTARVAEGARAVLLLLAQRDDLHAFEPATEIDPAWAAGLGQARARGVEAEAWTSRPDPTGITLSRRIPIRSPGTAG